MLRCRKKLSVGTSSRKSRLSRGSFEAEFGAPSAASSTRSKRGRKLARRTQDVLSDFCLDANDPCAAGQFATGGSLGGLRSTLRRLAGPLTTGTRQDGTPQYTFHKKDTAKSCSPDRDWRSGFLGIGCECSAVTSADGCHQPRTHLHGKNPGQRRLASTRSSSTICSTGR